MNCPVCQVELKMADRQAVEIDYCPKCRGVWLDRGEIDKLLERSNSAFAGEPTGKESATGRTIQTGMSASITATRSANANPFSKTSSISINRSSSLVVALASIRLAASRFASSMGRCAQPSLFLWPTNARSQAQNLRQSAQKTFPARRLNPALAECSAPRIRVLFPLLATPVHTPAVDRDQY
jgi:Zn-finger nucleic acid-binding protein